LSSALPKFTIVISVYFVKQYGLDLCVCVCVCVCVCPCVACMLVYAPCAFSVFGNHKRLSDFLDLKLEVTVSHHMGAEN